ncbi:MAG: sn-glycerol-1-phosphate dehydrogenase [Ruminococcaceae bacterium]|nr:sn-glycerol-1-phosphate dehydrogenase [Oscillospiraceae bacterium]
MNLNAIIDSLKDCPCGRKHSFDLKYYECESGLVHRCGEILKANSFPKKIYVVTDESAFRAAEGIVESLEKAGFDMEIKVYPDMKYAYMATSDEILKASESFDGILSVGTGSVNDVCRYAAARADKAFAIFGTAPSMDGFASDSAPLIANNFKISYPCRQPSIVLADADILAASPDELKSAGFGDVIAKYVGIVDWKVARYTVGEYYCENIVKLVKDTVDNVMTLADKVTSKSPEAAKAIMDTLILTGCAMQLAKCTRPASGSEHVVSHFWEIHKLEKGIWPDYHGKKVGMATLLVTKIYKALLKYDEIEPKKERFVIDDVLSHYSERNKDEILGYNIPLPTDEIDLEKFKADWKLIKEDIRTVLPDYDVLLEAMKKAGCATTLEECNLSPEFAIEGLIYSPYMRRRITLLRIMCMFCDMEEDIFL